MRRLRPMSRSSALPPSLPAVLPPSLPAALPTKTRRVELIVKLGGSCLTDKTRRHTLNPQLFTTAIEAIARLHTSGLGLIVVHGAGSFGHFEAAAHNISSGAASAVGMSETHAAVTRLNGLVVEALIEQGVPAVGVSPLLVPGRVRVEFVAALLDRGHLPVLHGDACYGGDGRTVVLSGDVLVGTLANGFDFVKRVVFLSDVDGVLDKPPGEGGKVIRRVVVGKDGQVKVDGGKEIRAEAEGVDVTGGILGKVVAAGRCVGEGSGRIVAFICRVGSEEAECAMTGRLPEPWSLLKCTRICFEGGVVDTEERGDVEVGGRRRWFGVGGGGEKDV